MSRCKYCNKTIGWIGKVPVTWQEVNILPARDGDMLGVTDAGQIVKGHRVGDQCEDGYFMCRVKHECRRKEDAV